jgi:hypothetical protein
MRTACPATCPPALTQPQVRLPGTVSRDGWLPAAAASTATAAVPAAGPARQAGTWMVIWSAPMVSDSPAMPACSMNAAAARSACAWAASGRAGIRPAGVPRAFRIRIH